MFAYTLQNFFESKKVVGKLFYAYKIPKMKNKEEQEAVVAILNYLGRRKCRKQTILRFLCFKEVRVRGFQSKKGQNTKRRFFKKFFGPKNEKRVMYKVGFF